MKAKTFEVDLHRLSPGKSPASAIEEQLNAFLNDRPQLRLLATHMNALDLSAQANAGSGPKKASTILFCTLFYTD